MPAVANGLPAHATHIHAPGGRKTVSAAELTCVSICGDIEEGVTPVTLDADKLRRLAALGLKPAVMSEILSILADIEESKTAESVGDSDRKARNSRHYQRLKMRRETRLNKTQALPPIEGPPHPLKNNPLPPPLEVERARARGTVLPESWSPSERLFDYAAKHGFTRQQADLAFESFRLWADANRNREVAKKADWDKTAMNWLLRNAPQIKPAGRSNGNSGLAKWVYDGLEDDEKRSEKSAPEAVPMLPFKR